MAQRFFFLSAAASGTNMATCMWAGAQAEGVLVAPSQVILSVSGSAARKNTFWRAKSVSASPRERKLPISTSTFSRATSSSARARRRRGWRCRRAR